MTEHVKSLTERVLAKIDATALVLLFFASVTVLYACARSTRVFARGSGRPHWIFTFLVLPLRERLQLVFILTAAANMAPEGVFGDRIEAFHWSLDVFTAFITTHSTAYVLWDLFRLFLRPQICRIVVGVFAIATNAIKFFTGFWAASIIVTFCTCVDVIDIYKINVQHAILVILMSIAVLVLRVWNWHLSDESATTETMTSALANIPAGFAVAKCGGSARIGIGDIIVPGLVLDLFWRSDENYSSHGFSFAFAGYVPAIVCSWIAAEVFGRDQPLLLWILPSIYISAIVTLWLEGRPRQRTNR